MRVAFVIRNLWSGGTERQLAYLAPALRRRGHEVAILQLFDGSRFEAELGDAGIVRDSLALRGRRDLARLAREGLGALRRFGPDVAYGLNVETNLLALLAGRLPPRPAVVWGIRVADPDAHAVDAPARAIARLHRALVGAPDLVVASSAAGAQWAERAGATAGKVATIRNGIDTTLFRPDAEGRRRVRAEWRVPDDARLVGTVARVERHKGYEAFVRAAAVLASRVPEARFVAVGAPLERRRFETLAAQLGVGGRILWGGERRDLTAVYSALDVATLLSEREATPNAVLEALACCVPCVVAAPGDAAAAVEAAGEVVDPRDAAAVAAAWERTIGRPAEAARALVEREFGLERLVDETEAALVELVGRRRRRLR